MVDVLVKGGPIDPDEINIAFIAVRAHADKSMYGKYISDEECRTVATEVVAAIENFKGGKTI